MQAQITYALDDRVSAALAQMNANMQTFGTAIQRVDGHLQQLQDAQKHLSLSAMSDNFRNLNQALTDFIQPGAAFQQQLHDLEGITGITGQQLNDLGQAARKVGVDSGLGAAQATEAFKILASNIDVAKLGNPEQQTAGLLTMQKAVIQLAQAGEVQMPAAAEAMAGAMNQFGLAAGEAGKVVDVLAAGAKAGAAEIPDLANSIKVTGATAAAAGLSIQQTVGALEVLSQKSIKGSEAGTALRNILLKLQTEGIKGVDIKAQGLAGALDAMKGKLNDTTFLAKTFGAENINAAQILIQNADAVKEMTAKVDENGIAAQMAGIRMDTYQGRMAQIKAQFDDFAISVFNGTNAWLPYMSMAGSALQTLGDFAPAMQLFKGSWTGVSSTVVAATGVLRTAWATTEGMSIATRIATVSQMGLNAAVAANPIGAAVAVAVALGAAIYYTYQKSVTFRETVAALGNTFSSTWQSLQPLINGVKSLWASFDGSSILTTVTEYVITPLIRKLQAMLDLIRVAAEAWNGFQTGDFSAMKGAAVDAATHFLGRETNNDRDAKRLYDYNNGVKPQSDFIGNIAEQFKTAANPNAPKLPKAPKPKTEAKVTEPTKNKKEHGGGGGGNKIITVNINQLIGINNLHSSNVKEAMPNMRNMVTQEIITAIRDAEAID